MPWFWDVELSGGGVLLDMGCHSVEYGRWVFGKPPVKSVTAYCNTFVHKERTKGEDHSLMVIEYEGGKINIAENSWAKGGGVDDRCEIYGSKRADLLKELVWTLARKAMATLSKKPGPPAAGHSPCSKKPGIMASPRRCNISLTACSGKRTPSKPAKRREVLKILYAAYQSAVKVIASTLQPTQVEKPIDLWRK
jgi:hypothetical protein